MEVLFDSPPAVSVSDPRGDIAWVVETLSRAATVDQEFDVLVSPAPDTPRTRVSKKSGTTEIHVHLVADDAPAVTSVAADLANALRGLR
jgi:hypothetical protein